MTVEVSKEKLILFGLAVIIFGGENCFYLIDVDSASGAFGVQDIFWVIGFFWLAYILITYWHFPNPHYHYAFVIYGVIALAVLSSIQSNNLYGMSLMLGLRPQRYWLLYALLYFPISKLLYNNIITVKQIVNMLIIIGICECSLYIVQFILSNYVTFLHVNSSVRYGEIRYYYRTMAIRFFMWISLSAFMNGKSKIKNILYVIAVLFILVFVVKMRMTSIATIAAIVIGIVLWRNGGKNKVVTIAFGIFALGMLLNTDLFQDSISSILDYFGGSTTDVNISIRENGRAWYLAAVSQHPLLGCGYISTLNRNAYVAAGMDQNILLVDNGVWGFLFQYGTIGIIWCFALFGKILRDSWKLIREARIYYPFLFAINLIFQCTSEIHWYWNDGFIFIVILIAIIPFLETEEDDFCEDELQMSYYK